jgi:hypothetical protein
LVVHVARLEDLLDHPRDKVNVGPVRRGFRGRQAGKVDDVTASKNDDRMTASDGMPLKRHRHFRSKRAAQVGVRRTSTPLLVSGRPSPQAMFVSSAFPLASAAFFAMAFA